MLLQARTKVTMTMESVARLENPSLTMDEAEARLLAAGNKILARDDDARTFKVAQATSVRILEAGTFVADVEAIQAGLLDKDTALVPCTATGCRAGTAFEQCTQCTNGHVAYADGRPADATSPICTNCDGGGNSLGGPCPTCGGYGVVAGV